MKGTQNQDCCCCGLWVPLPATAAVFLVLCRTTAELLQWLLTLQIHELRLSCKFLLTLQNFLIATIDILSPIFSSVKQHQQQTTTTTTRITNIFSQQAKILSTNNALHPTSTKSLHPKFSPPNKQKQISPPKIPFTQLASTNISPPTSKTNTTINVPPEPCL
jgi:hypothetical protein